MTPPSASKRPTALEVRLVGMAHNRTTRRISLMPEGGTDLTEGTRMLADLDTLATHHRVLCAACAFLERAGKPATPRELLQHSCIMIRESDEFLGA